MIENKPLPKVALTIWQPYAWLIVKVWYEGKKGIKPLENRSWGYESPLFRFKPPFDIFIHAGKKNDPKVHEDAWEVLRSYHPDWKEIIELYEQEKVFGAVIGRATITGVAENYPDPWSVMGQKQFLLDDPRQYVRPILCPGQQGFFYPDLSAGGMW